MIENYPFSINKNFEKIIETQLKKPDIAILELISNSWDANAHNVYIEWPNLKNFCETPSYFTILDEGKEWIKMSSLKNGVQWATKKENPQK